MARKPKVKPIQDHVATPKLHADWVNPKTGKAKEFKSFKYKGVYWVHVYNDATRKFERSYTIRYRLNGVSKSEGVGWEHRDDMDEEKASYRRAQIKNKDVSPKTEIKAAAKAEAANKKWTIQDVWDDRLANKGAENKEYSKQVDLARYTKWVKPWFGGCVRDDITKEKVQKWLQHLLKQEEKGAIKTATRAHAIKVFKKLLKHAEANVKTWDKLDFEVPVPAVHNEIVRFLNQDEFQRLIQVCTEQKHKVMKQAGNFILLLIYTGSRRGELFNLKWDDINFETKTMTKTDPKSGRPEKIPLNQFALDVLKSIDKKVYKDVESEYVFAGRAGNMITDIKKAALKIKAAAKLPTDFRPLHDYRHSFASMLISSGKYTIFEVSKLLNHKDIKITMKYAHLHPDANKLMASKADTVIAELLGIKAPVAEPEKAPAQEEFGELKHLDNIEAKYAVEIHQ